GCTQRLRPPSYRNLFALPRQNRFQVERYTDARSGSAIGRRGMVKLAREEKKGRDCFLETGCYYY
ncbi:MAG TPA: hypothetical protein VNK46_05070, partial [Nitrospiraceae bacterium]|nr:hypothetical protein [Nitrospiraceae bacterium]